MKRTAQKKQTKRQRIDELQKRIALNMLEVMDLYPVERFNLEFEVEDVIIGYPAFYRKYRFLSAKQTLKINQVYYERVIMKVPPYK
jgi:hypothetical protein